VVVGDTQWTHFQAPFVVEDAFSFKFPVPSEYDYGMMENIIHYRFSEGVGAKEVRAGNYELVSTNRRSEVITATSRLLPGAAVVMAIFVIAQASVDASCQMPQCGSLQASNCPGGGFIWYVVVRYYIIAC
jgi:hypothetical protein